MTRSAAATIVLAVISVVSLVCTTDTRSEERFPLRQLTNDPAQDGFPSWSPDGKTIVFERIGADPTAPDTGLWLVASEGGVATQLTRFIGEHPSWSPDGRYIVFDADEGNSIKLIAASGGSPVRIVPDSVPVFRGGNPIWSPDGSRVAFREGTSLWVLDVSTGRLRDVFCDESVHPIPTCWSRDGETIIACLRAAEGRQSNLWALSVAGEKRRQLTFETEGVYRYADLSPDGSLLAFVKCEGRNCDLWIMPAGGGKAVRITDHPAYDDTPRWSPDGGTIAFTSTRSGNFEVWTIQPDIAAIRDEMAAPGR